MEPVSKHQIPAAAARFAARLDVQPDQIDAAHRQFSIFMLDETNRLVVWHADGVKVDGVYLDRKAPFGDSCWISGCHFMSMKKAAERVAEIRAEKVGA